MRLTFIAKKIVLIVLVIVLGCLFTGDTQVYAGEENSTYRISQVDLQKFMDEFFEDRMEKYHVPGAAVAVVKDGKEMLYTSYGVRDMESNEPVTENTKFPACSVSKLFTATAIMQLTEQGKIDLQTDIKKYVPSLKINNTYDKAITCHQLMTHSSGLDEQSELDVSTLNLKNLKPQSDYFKEHVPTVVHEPGTISCYSNMGYNLLGYLVEKISGESYENYVQNNIIKPLQMKNTTVRIHNSDMASGYYYDNGKYMKQPFAYQYTSGSSGVISTVRDMEKFMQMHLNEGKYGDTCVLEQEMAQQMYQKQFANDEVFDGMGYGFIRTHYGKIKVLKHEGALPGYATTMLLIPHENLGIYVVTNNTTAICFDFEDSFMKAFYGKEAIEGNTNQKQISKKTEDLSAYTGTYRNYDGISHQNLMKLGILFDTSTDMKIVKTDSNMLEVTYYNQHHEKVITRLKYCGNHRFLRLDDGGYITFAPKANETSISYAFTQVSHCTYEKVKFYEKKIYLLLGFSSILGILFTTVICIIKYIKQRKVSKKIQLAKFFFIAGQFLITTVTLLIIIDLMYMISSYDSRGINILYFLFILQLIGAFMMLISSAYGIYQTIYVKMSLKRKVYVYTSIGMQLIFLLTLSYFHLLGIHIF